MRKLPPQTVAIISEMDKNTQSGFIASSIAAIIEPNPRYKDIVALINFCHKIAVAYLRRKAAADNFHPQRFGVSLEDFAFDSIAELFGRDEAGSYTAIRNFIHRLGPLQARTEDEIAGAIRRLVFSAVNQTIFRSYQTSDPTLARILRNIKLALKKHPSVQAIEHAGETYIVPRRVDKLHSSLPAFTPEMLSPLFFDQISADSDLKEMLAVLGSILASQKTYSRMISIVEAALLIRSAYLSDLKLLTEFVPTWEASDEELSGMIDRVVRQLEKTKATAYLRKGKLTQTELDAHVAAVGCILKQQFIGSDKEARSFFESLKSCLPTITEEDYAAKHRTIFEYLVRLAMNDLKARVKGEL